MEFEYIIVQCGGKGTRLKDHTKNRPKALVPVENRPILFHLFERYPNKKFVIIGDYKREVLSRYLDTFANVSFLYITASEEGNVAGIMDAVNFIPDYSPFLLLWSDLVLGDAFHPEQLPFGNYVGVTDKFSCSWSFEGSKLVKIPTDTCGVAGCFLFKGKEDFRQLPKSGSFTRWLGEQEMELLPMDMMNSFEVGTVENFKSHNRNENRCRPYNKMVFHDKKVEKIGLTLEAEKLINREIEWYKALSQYNFQGIPRIYSTNPLVMERIYGENIFRANLDGDQKLLVLERLIKTLAQMHNLQPGQVNRFDMQLDYYRKTIRRLRTIEAVLPFATEPEICINGRNCINPLRQDNLFREIDRLFMKRLPKFGIIHGDCTFTNTLLDEQENIFFIDARGYFGSTSLIGDTCYDWAKVYYSVVGAFDQFNIKNFKLLISEKNVAFRIGSSGWEQYESCLIELINKEEPVDTKVIHYIHAIIWLSLASHCWEDYDSMCLAFYKGVELFQRVLDEMGGYDKNEYGDVVTLKNMDI